MSSVLSAIKQAVKGTFSRIAKDLITFRWLIAAALAAFILCFGLFHKNCIFSLLIGYPCPGCGLTRAFLCVVTFHFKEAFFYNPSIYPAAVIAIYFFICRYVLDTKPKYLTTMCIAAGIIAIIIYIIRMYYMYPDVEPMTYYDNNLLQNILKKLPH